MTQIEMFVAELERRIKENRERYKTTNVVSVNYLIECYHQLLDFVEDMRKNGVPETRTDYPYVPGWRKNYDGNKPEIKHSVLMFTTHGVVEGEWLGDKWIQYRWSAPVKDSEVLYWIHLCDLERLEKEGDE